MSTKTISEIYNAIRASSDVRPLLEKYSLQGLDPKLEQERIKENCEIYNGKVRHLIIKGDKIAIIHSDRLSAFDRFIGAVPLKGVILAEISDYWLTQAKKVADTHLLGRIDSRTLLVERMDPIKVEVIVRGYLAGSMMRAYESGQREFCGQTLPEGLTPYCKLEKPIITPTTKAAVFEHDEDISSDELIERGVCSKSEWDRISSIALSLFELGTEINQKLGWILVDTKYEFGRDVLGEIKIIDEVHTPDSSRFWVESSYSDLVSKGSVPEMLDKEIVRRYLMDQGFKGEGDVPNVPVEVLLNLGEVYLNVGEKLIGRPIKVDV